LLAHPQGLSQHLRGVAAASMAGHDVVADVAAAAASWSQSVDNPSSIAASVSPAR